MMLTDLDRTLRDAGLSVVTLPGWKTRGHGQMDVVRTITCHHTANGGAKGPAPSLHTVTNGRADLAGPLAQLFLGRDGIWFVVAAGLSYHAGVSLERRFENAHAIGIEAEAVGVPGTAGDWPEEQMESYAFGVAALMRRYGLRIGDVKGHKETATEHPGRGPLGRKSDPSFDMDVFRSRVMATTVEEEMRVTDDDVAKIAKAVAAATAKFPIPNKNPDAPDGAPSSIAGSIVDIERTQDANTAALAHIAAALTRIEVALKDLIEARARP